MVHHNDSANALILISGLEPAKHLGKTLAEICPHMLKMVSKTKSSESISNYLAVQYFQALQDFG